MTDVHRWPVRVYYEDTDAAGIVYYANYLKFAERARTEMMRVSGASHSGMIEAFDTAFAVSRCEIDYLKPARLDDQEADFFGGRLQLRKHQFRINQPPIIHRLHRPKYVPVRNRYSHVLY